jgi:mercuric ion transport protein
MTMNKQLEHVLTESLAPRREVSKQASGKILASIGSVLAAIAASSCCVIPLVLFTLGVSGAWISHLTALAPYQPLFVALTLAFLAWGFWMVYRRPKIVCTEDYCARPISERIAKTGLWVATVLIAIALAFPYVTPLFGA